MNSIDRLCGSYPTFEQIQTTAKYMPEAAYMLEKALGVIHKVSSGKIGADHEEVEESAFLVEALADKCWELIHTSQFSNVPLETRKIYALACLCKIPFLLLENTERSQLERCSTILDEAGLIGWTKNLFTNCNEFIAHLTDFLDTMLAEYEKCENLAIIEEQPRSAAQCDIPILNKPSLEEFSSKCFQLLQPTLLLNTIAHWPALQLWRNLNYIHKIAGNRTVPIEIGNNYASEEWSQQLMKIKDFLQRQFPANPTDGKNTESNVEYLAQHELFEQIPQLKKDFSIPEYCSLGAGKEPVDIKAWLGPKGTISPMHYDPKHNLLCQVFGSKSIILCHPEATNNLYPHPCEFLNNTSQIDPTNVDSEMFPLTKNVRFLHLTLQPGDCLYMPPKWWHYVRSEAPSFSVSFWWE